MLGLNSEMPTEIPKSVPCVNSEMPTEIPKSVSCVNSEMPTEIPKSVQLCKLTDGHRNVNIGTVSEKKRAVSEQIY